MTAITASDEIQAAAIHRIQRRVDRFAADHGNRGRRQAGDHVGVVRRRFLEMSARELAAVTVAQPVDYGRIGLQHHADGHAPHEHAGNLPALLRHARFLLDQRGHDQGLIRPAVRQIGCALIPFLGQDFVETVIGGLQQLDVGHATYETVGVGEEPPFRENPGMAELVHDLAVAQAVKGVLDFFFFGQRHTDLMEIPAFDQGEAVLDHFPALPQVDQAFDSHAGRHAVFAAVQRLLGQVEAPVNA
ncbi:hypothetical protein D3C84_721160 [compost metagenome]